MQVKKKIGPTTKGAIEPHNAAYDPVDKLFRQIFGNFPSISNSWPGNYGKATLETIQKAQEVKYDNYFKYLGLKENSGMKIFEIGPGWGPFPIIVEQEELMSPQFARVKVNMNI
jgi:cyclopropane fatty-acyl-phospholipid synthase-like methyltransferase